MRKLLSCMLAGLLAVQGFGGNVFAAASGKIKVGSANAEPGTAFELPVEITENPGVAALSLELTYDASKLELVSVTDGKILGTSTFLSGKDLTQIPYTMNWDDLADENNTGTGNVAVLSFKAKADAYGSAEVKVEVNQKSTFNIDLEEVPFKTESGTVTFMTYAPQVVTTAAAVATTAKAAATTTAAITTTAKPAATATAAIATTAKPAATTTAAIATTAKPAATTTAAIATTTAAVETTAVTTRPGVTTTPAVTGAIKIDQVTAAAGEKVKVPVRILSNPGLAALSLNFSYDKTRLKLLGAEDGKILGSSTFLAGNDLTLIPYTLNWDDLSDKDNTGTGVAATLEFEVLAAGTAAVEVVVNQRSTFNVDLVEIPFAVENGSVKAEEAEPVKEGLKGDVNQDGAVSVEDAQLALKAYTDGFSGKGTGLNETQEKNGDVNGDGTLSVDDAQNILIYYVKNTVSGTATTWEELIPDLKKQA